MAYGIALKNEFNDDLVDVTEGFTYYAKVSGNCMRSSSGADTGNERRFVPVAAFITSNDVTLKSYATSGFNEYNVRNYIAAPSIQTFTSKGSTTQYGVASTNINDLVFFKLPPEGIIRLVQSVNDFAANSYRCPLHISAIAVTSKDLVSTAVVPYRVVSTDLPPSNGNYGVRTFGADGEVKFDTTREIASFADHITLTRSQVISIVDSNAVVDITLRKPVINPWVSSSFFAGYRAQISDTSRMWSVNMKPLNSTTFRFSREAVSKTTNNATYNRTRYEDLNIIIGDYG